MTTLDTSATPPDPSDLPVPDGWSEPEALDWIAVDAAYRDLLDRAEDATERTALELAIQSEHPDPRLPDGGEVWLAALTQARAQATAATRADLNAPATPSARLDVPEDLFTRARARLDELSLPEEVAAVVYGIVTDLVGESLAIARRDERRNIARWLRDRAAGFASQLPLLQAKHEALTLAATRLEQAATGDE